MLLGTVALLTSCSTDNDSNPTIKSPTSFTINESPLADQYIQLSAGNRVNLTWSQPNYGYNAFATYRVQVGVVDNGTVKWNEKDGAPKYLATPYTICNANINGEEIAEAICEIVRSLAKTLLPSMTAALARGPKQGMPASSSASTQPSTSGSSGVTTA